MPSCPAWLSSVAALLALVSGETFTGYVVDNYCWDRPGHRGIDGSQLATNPGSHILHCFWQVPACRNGGYLMLERLGSTTAEGYLYGAGPQLDAAGDNLVYELSRQEQTRGGDRGFDEQFTITGTLANGEIAVEQACLTPRVNNPNGETFCLPQTAATTTTGDPTTTTLDATTTDDPTTTGDPTTTTMDTTTTDDPTTTGDPTTTTMDTTTTKDPTVTGDPTTTTLDATTTDDPTTTGDPTTTAVATTVADDSTTTGAAEDVTTSNEAAMTTLPETTMAGATTTTPTPTSVVNLGMTISGIDYTALSADSTKKASFIVAVEAGIVEEFNFRVQGQQISADNIETTLREVSARRLEVSALRALQSSNGVLVESEITLPSRTESASAASTLRSVSSSLGNTVTRKIQAVANIQSVTLAGATIGVSEVMAETDDSTTTMEEANPPPSWTPQQPRIPQAPLTAGASRCQMEAVLALLLAGTTLRAQA